MTGGADVAGRADLLGAFTKVLGGADQAMVGDGPALFALAAGGGLGHGELAALELAAGGGFDYGLVNRCLELEADLRAREWAAAETLLGLLVCDGDGVWRLPTESDDETFRRAVGACATLGWLEVARDA